MVLRTDLPDHRRATEADLVTALRNRDPLALAEAYHRTIPAAHAAARRLLSGSSEVEALLRQVYTELWADPPHDVALEGWIRSRCFAIAADDLRERDAAPASPSLTALLPELPRPEVRYLDAAERALADLDAEQRRALLLAHDRGLPTTQHDEDDAERSLTAALLALAGPEPGNDSLDIDGCADVPTVGDWVLGLLPPPEATSVAERVAARPECTALAKALRRGRRRLEGLPPTPDMGQRVLVVVLAGSPVAPRVPAAVAGMPSALDAGTGPIDVVPPAPARQNGGQADEGATPDRPGVGNVYAELAELDDPATADQPLDAGDRDDDDFIDSAPDDEGYDEAYTPSRRSWASRIVVWILAALFMVAGVAAGLYLGLTLLS